MEEGDNVIFKGVRYPQEKLPWIDENTDRLIPPLNDSSESSDEENDLFIKDTAHPKKSTNRYHSGSSKFAERVSLMSSFIQGKQKMKQHKVSLLEIDDESGGGGMRKDQYYRSSQRLTIQEATSKPTFISDEEPEGTISFLVQFMIPFLMAGIGQLMAGLILDKIQHWEAVQVIPNIYILIPALLGLKGNCEMCLASRLSTQANVNSHESTQKFLGFVFSNLGIVQVHSISIGFLAATGANILGWIPEGIFDVHHAILLTASCVLTASMTSLLLGSVMVMVFFLSKLCHINPDNVATPIAASLGDLATVFILANSTSILIDIQCSWKWASIVIIASCFFVLPFWWNLAYRNPLARISLLYGWQPVAAAMVISSIGGLIMEYSIVNFRGIAVYQLIVNGVAGNLVAVQANANAHTTRILLAMTIPGHLIFNYAVASLNAGHTSTTPIFMTVYLITSLIQVLILLYICHVMIYKMWRRGINPDNSAIPYLTAIADCLGMAFLSGAFEFLFLIGDRDDDIGD